jgi:hypothetical protein
VAVSYVEFAIIKTESKINEPGHCAGLFLFWRPAAVN